MNATVRELARLSELHLLCMLEHPSQRESQEEVEYGGIVGKSEYAAAKKQK